MRKSRDLLRPGHKLRTLKDNITDGLGLSLYVGQLKR